MSYRFAVRPRWIAMHVLVLTVVSLFAVAGFWQLQRLSGRRAQNALIRDREAKPVRSLDDVLSGIRAAGGAAHRSVRVVGRFDTSEEVVLIGRPDHNGVDGSHVLTPLVIDKDDAVLVDRGWVPPGMEEPPVKPAAPVADEVVVSGVLLPSEGEGPFGGTGAEPTQITRIDVARLAASSKHRFITTDLYVLLQGQKPPQVELPRPVKPLGLSEGPHFAYAVQWFLFIPIAVAVYVVLVRQRSRKRPDDQ